jgi:hypothetical protein
MIMKGIPMIVSERFYLDKGYVIDRLDPDVRADTFPELGLVQQDLRYFILDDRLRRLVSDLLPATAADTPIQRDRLVCPLRAVIVATVLPTTEPLAYAGALPANDVDSPKPGLRQFTSLSLFVRDLELHLQELYGPVPLKVMTPISEAALDVTREVLRYSHPALVQEHKDAGDWDYFGWGIGWPVGYGRSQSEYGIGLRALERLRGRIRDITQNPALHNKFTVEFASRLEDV